MLKKRKTTFRLFGLPLCRFIVSVYRLKSQKTLWSVFANERRRSILGSQSEVHSTSPDIRMGPTLRHYNKR